MKKAYICPEGHSLLVDENLSMTGRCPVCNTDYPLYLLTPNKKKKEVKVAKAPAKKVSSAAKAAKKPKAAAKPTAVPAEKPVEIPATASKAAPVTKKPAAKKTTKKKKK